MFQATRIKLTAWYLSIIMFISILFSVVIYLLISQELERGYRRLTMRPDIRREIFRDGEIPEFLEPGALDSAKERVRNQLVNINIIILAVSGISGYFLAGRTLRPIKDMIDEQHRFISDASHELRTPLTALRTEIEVNMRDKKLKLADARSILASNLEEVIHLQNLSDNMLQLSQYEGNPGKLPMEPVPLQSIVDTAVRKVEPLSRSKGIRIENAVSDGAIVFGNRENLVQLFVIFLDNAIKYSPKNTNITITHEDAGMRDLTVHITDQGIGIEKKDLPYLFDRFFRTDLSRSKLKVSGYGLGLSIAKKIVESHNGYITVKSRIGKGTTFSVRLPKGKMLQV